MINTLFVFYIAKMIRKSGKNWEKYFILEKKYSRVYFKCFYLCFTKEKEERVVNKLQLFPLFLSGATRNRAKFTSGCISSLLRNVTRVISSYCSTVGLLRFAHRCSG